MFGRKKTYIIIDYVQEVTVYDYLIFRSEYRIIFKL